MYSKYFKGKKVLLTGHTGFKGSWAALWLLEMGADVVGYSLAPDQNPALFETLGLEKDLKHYQEDIRNAEAVHKVFRDEQPEIVLHYAAQPLVRRSYKEPHETFATNIMGTVNLLEAVRATDSVRTVVNVTTDKCYENKEWVYGYRETDPLGGYDPYSASKAGAEIVTASYRNSFFNPKDHGKTHQVALASARAGNVIGGGDWSEDRLVPDCIRFLKDGQPIVIRNPLATRPWQHVLEPVSGYFHLATKLMDNPQEFAQAWNFGPDDGSNINVGTLTEKVISFWGSGSVEHDKSHQAHEAQLLKLDLSKTKSQLKYFPVLDIDETLKMTVDWYKEYLDNEGRIRDFTVKQIKSYQDKSLGCLEPVNI